MLGLIIYLAAFAAVTRGFFLLIAGYEYNSRRSSGWDTDDLVLSAAMAVLLGLVWPLTGTALLVFLVWRKLGVEQGSLDEWAERKFGAKNG
jgi:hypothetical protein